MALTLVGRENEQKIFRNKMEEAVAGKGSTIIITGEPGIGKSALVNDACKAATGMGFSVRQGTAPQEATKPFGILSDALSELTQSPLFDETEYVSFAEVFAINSAGLLMAKASVDGDRLDADIFAGMLTAVQSFVRDSFDYSGTKGANLGRLEYGDLKIMIENGRNLFITAVLIGQEHAEMADAIRNSIKEIETKYGDMLESWNGNMSAMPPVRHILERLAGKKFMLHRDMENVNLEAEINRISDAAFDALRTECAHNPVLLVLEDTHWSDEGSLKVTEYIARNCPEMPLVLLCSARTSESNTFENFRRGLTFDGTALEMKLGGFDLPAMKQMIDGHFSPNSFPHSFYRDMFSRTEGNPLFALEMARHLKDAGAINLVCGSYIFDEIAATLPDTINELIARRLDSISPQLLLITEIASCMGREFDSAVLGSVSMLEDSATEMEALNSSGIMTFTGSKGKFSHGLFQEITYDSISPRWKAKYHADIGHCLERMFTENTEEVIFDLARHFSNTSEHAKTLRYCIRAGEKAESGFAAKQAMEFYGKAIAVCKGDMETQSMLHERIGDLCFILGEFDESRNHYLAILGLSPDRIRQADIHRKIGDAWERQADFDKAKSECAVAIEIVAGKGNAAEARILTSLGRIYMRQGDYSTAISYLEKTIHATENLGLRKDLGTAEHLLGSVYLHKGQYPDALEHFNKAILIRREVGDLSGLAASVNNIGNVMARTGEWDKALEHYKSSAEIDAKIGDKIGVASTLTNIATVHLSTGHPDEAIPTLEESITIERKIGDRRGLAISLLNLNLAYYLKGEYDRSIAILTEALDICEKNSLKYECIFCYNGLCELYSLSGRAAEGQQLARKSLALAREIGTTEGESMSHMNLGIALLASGDMEPARENLEAALSLMKKIGHNQISDANMQLGLYWKKVGDKIKARAYFNDALAGFEKNSNKGKTEDCRKSISELDA
uniref:Photosystem I assembly protein Ycf3 n=1 Tax=uncultured Thermoplasmata archaeon TaxID=376542 RepID=A0A871XYQ9_9ARCH|nr:Tetratricopeptide repeat protein [uncultured Thermoplasmata archaeon]